jgi:hypothetical protein
MNTSIIIFFISIFLIIIFFIINKYINSIYHTVDNFTNEYIEDFINKV